jgi:hypothetical protein
MSLRLHKAKKKTISFDGTSFKKGQLSKMTVVFTLYSPYGGGKGI